jgi:hypothetical protein
VLLFIAEKFLKLKILHKTICFALKEPSSVKNTTSHTEMQRRQSTTQQRQIMIMEFAKRVLNRDRIAKLGWNPLVQENQSLGDCIVYRSTCTRAPRHRLELEWQNKGAFLKIKLDEWTMEIQSTAGQPAVEMDDSLSTNAWPPDQLDASLAHLEALLLTASSADGSVASQ